MVAKLNAAVSALRDQAQKSIAVGAAHIGDVVFFDVANVRVPRTDLRAVFAKHGFEAYCVEAMDPSTALSRACGRPIPADLKIERIAFARSDTDAAFMVYQIGRVQGEQGDTFTPGSRIRIERDAAGDKHAIAMPPEDGVAIPLCEEVAKSIASTCNRIIDFAEGRDLTGAVIRVVMGALEGYAMRERGGLYFLKPDKALLWHAFANELSPFGLVKLGFPVAGDPASVATVQHVVRSGLETKLEELSAALDKVSDATRKSTMEARAQECLALVDEADVFADILGGIRDTLVQRANDARAGFLAKLGIAGTSPSGSGPASPRAPLAAPEDDDDDLLNFDD